MDKNIKSLILEHKVVSFDIYDTLLIRLFCKPLDLFKYISVKEHCDEFFKTRIQAEKEARKSIKEIKEDLTLDEIYNFMPQNLQLFKNIELEYEKKYTVKHYENFEIYKEALIQEKKVIFISDMYLPKDFLLDLLKVNGYDKYDELFVSGDIGKTKVKGSLYPYVINKLSIEPSDIIHFGDSFNNDIKQAKKYKIDCYKLEPYINKFLYHKNHKKFLKFYKAEKDNIYASILISIFALHYLKENNFASFDELLGYYIAGIVAYSYIQFIISVSSDFDTILFVARDGYLLQKVYNKLAENPKTNIYINAQRILNIQCFENPKYQYQLLKAYMISHSIKFNKWILYFRQNHYAEKYKNELSVWVTQNYNEYQQYLKKLNINGKNLLSVDMTTANYTSKRFLQKMLPKRSVCGAFLSTVSSVSEEKTYIYLNKELLFKNKYVYFVAEPLFTSKEPPILGISDSEPLYNNYSNEFSKLITERVNAIEKGMFNFIEELNTYFDKIILPKEIVNSFLYKYAQYPSSQDIEGYKSTLLSDGNIQNKLNSNLYKKLKKCFKRGICL